MSLVAIKVSYQHFTVMLIQICSFRFLAAREFVIPEFSTRNFVQCLSVAQMAMDLKFSRALASISGNLG